MDILVDEIDRDLLKLRWSQVPKINTTHLRNNHQYIHRIIMGRVLGRALLDSEQVDHKNNNGFDNRRSNLRLATHSQNKANTPIQQNNTSGYKGVIWWKRDNNWRARIQFQNRTIHIGYYGSKEEAARAYNAKAIELFGEFAVLNEGV